MKLIIGVVINILFLALSQATTLFNPTELTNTYNEQPEPVSNIEFNILHNQAHTSPTIKWTKSTSRNIQLQMIRLYSDPSGKYPMSDWVVIDSNKNSYTYSETGGYDCLEHYVGVKVKNIFDKYSEQIISPHGFYVDSYKPAKIKNLLLSGVAQKNQSPKLSWDYGKDNCGVKLYEVKIANVNSSEILLNWTNIGTDRFYKHYDNIFKINESYMISVRALDYVHNKGTSVGKVFKIEGASWVEPFD